MLISYNNAFLTELYFGNYLFYSNLFIYQYKYGLHKLYFFNLPLLQQYYIIIPARAFAFRRIYEWHRQQ